MKKKVKDKGLVWRIIGIAILTLVVLFSTAAYFSSIFVVFVFGVILIYTSERIMGFYNSLLKDVNISKPLKKWFGTFIVVLVIGFAILLTGSSISDIVDKFNEPQFGDDPLQGIYNQNVAPYIPDELEKNLINEGNVKIVEDKIFGFLSSGVSQIGSFIFTGLLIIPLMFATYYRKKDTFAEDISKSFLHKFHDTASKVLVKIGTEMSGYLGAKFMESFFIALICCIGFFFLGLEGWLFIGILAGFLNIVPYVGPILGSILPILIAITHDPITVFITLGVLIFAQLVDNFYLVPIMVSGKVKMNPLLSIMLILVGAQLFGAFGMIFVIPMYLVSKIIILELYKEYV